LWKVETKTIWMKNLKLIGLTIIQLLKLIWFLPRSIVAATRQTRRGMVRNKLEAERLDRIRNPEKYLGKWLDPVMNTKIYVENIAPATTENELGERFSTYGNVAGVNRVLDRTHQKPWSLGFVTMVTLESARAAYFAFDFGSGKLQPEFLGERLLWYRQTAQH
jgi:hypothetical protein